MSVILRMFCCVPRATPSKRRTIESPSDASVANQVDVQEDNGEKPVTTIIYDKPPQEPVPSMEPQITFTPAPEIIEPLEEEPVGRRESNFDTESTELRVVHRRWSSVLSLMATPHPLEYERRFTSRGFHFPRKRSARVEDLPPPFAMDDDDESFVSRPMSYGRPRAYSAPDEPTEHQATAMAIIRVGMIQVGLLNTNTDDDAQALVQGGDSRRPSEAQSCRELLPPRPHTPPFQRPRISMAPIPSNLPTFMKSAVDNRSRKSLSRLSHWLEATDRRSRFSTGMRPTSHVRESVAIRAAFQAFAFSGTQARRFSEGSATTVTTAYTEDSSALLSPSLWPRNSFHSSAPSDVPSWDDYFAPRKTSTGGTKKPSPLSIIGDIV